MYSFRILLVTLASGLIADFMPKPYGDMPGTVGSEKSACALLCLMQAESYAGGKFPAHIRSYCIREFLPSPDYAIGGSKHEEKHQEQLQETCWFNASQRLRSPQGLAN